MTILVEALRKVFQVYAIVLCHPYAVFEATSVVKVVIVPKHIKVCMNIIFGQRAPKQSCFKKVLSKTPILFITHGDLMDAQIIVFGFTMGG
ncbi:Uncharacterized protein TCM_006562 [Theobroma cacao]|uniref:Uncharacterized protein n=1 Tax=Theobroma cacao TaxID=3641 RepID=A0A061DZS1_THECC|nr:Uncharacterized protein TCM_006562 [Theobroma cacao]